MTMAIKDPTENKRRALYLAKAVTRNDKSAIAALESEFPGEAKRIANYQKVYYDPSAPGHKEMVSDVAAWYETAGDWLE
jgi:hypothetical protein